MFVNRQRELELLQRWWTEPRSRLALVRGRRRVGKTSLLQHFAEGRRTVFHTGAGRPAAQELRLLGQAAAGVVGRDLERRPLRDWDEAVEVLVAAAQDEPLLVVLDELPELVAPSPELPGVLRAHLDSDVGHLKLLLCGSAVRAMWQVQEARAPLYGRADLSLLVHPFEPAEVGGILRDLTPAERARVYAVTGGVPLYLSWWDQAADVAANLRRLVTEPDGRLLLEGQLVLATEAGDGDLPGRVLRAVATGRTRSNEVADEVRADPTRTLERLVELRLLERRTPVTDDERQTRRRVYRVADPFLAFWLGVVDRYRSQVERGLGDGVLPAVVAGLDDHSGAVWEEAVRTHVRRLAARRELVDDDVVAVGEWWRDRPEPVQLDVVALTGRERRVAAVGEAKWSTRVDGRRLAADVRRRAAGLDHEGSARLVLAARERVDRPDDGTLVLTADDVFPDAGRG